MLAVGARTLLGVSLGPSPWFVVPFLTILVATWAGGTPTGLVAAVVAVGGGILVPGSDPTPLDPRIVAARPYLELLVGVSAMLLGLVIRRIGVAERRSRIRAAVARREAAGSGTRVAMLLDAIERLDTPGSPLQGADELGRWVLRLTDAAEVRIALREASHGSLAQVARIRRDELTPETLTRARHAVSETARLAVATGEPAWSDGLVAIPLLTGDGPVGAIEIGGSDLDAADTDGRLATVVALAHLAGVRLERQRSTDAQRRALESAATAWGRLARLQRLSGALATALTADVIGEAVLRESVDVLQAHVALFYLVGRGGELELVRHVGYPPGLAERDARLPISAGVPAAEAIRERSVVIVDSPATWRRRYPGTSDVFGMTGTKSAVAIPLRGPDGPMGAIVVHVATEGRPSEEDLGFLLVAAQQGVSALERARLYADEQEARRIQEAFMGVMSHELRTPITTIYAGSKLLGRDRALTPLARELSSDIEAEADRLFRLVEDLLVLSRFDRTSLPVGEEPVHVTRVLERIVASESARWPATRFELPHARVVHLASGEETYVEQVVRNLLANAAKYGGAGGAVEIRPERDGDSIVVRILDRGPGILPEEADRLFDLYYRSPSTASTAAGAGIGLYVCRRLVDAMGGRIWARRRDDGGSEFAFSLQAYPEEEEQLLDMGPGTQGTAVVGADALPTSADDQAANAAELSTQPRQPAIAVPGAAVGPSAPEGREYRPPDRARRRRQ